MNRRHSLSGRRNFQRLYRQGNSWKQDTLKIRYILDPVDHSQFAIAIPRACGNAVVRNRLRRVYREAIRLSMSQWPPGQYHLRLDHPVVARQFKDIVSLLARFRESLAGQNA